MSKNYFLYKAKMAVKNVKKNAWTPHSALSGVLQQTVLQQQLLLGIC